MAVPSRVSLLILYTSAESGAYSRDSSQCPQRCPYIFTTIHHRVSHDFIGSRNCVPMAFTASPLCPNIVTAVLLLYILWTRFLPPTYVCTSVESLVYTVQYHMLCFKTYRGTMYYCCKLWTGFYPPDLCLFPKAGTEVNSKS